MPDTKQKPSITFILRKNNGTRYVCTGPSKEEVLMKHLVFKTREVGHQISLDEARNPDFIIMIRPEEFGEQEEFEKAAQKAWNRLQLGI